MCVLRADGAEFQPEAFLKSSSLLPCAVYQRGEAKFRSKPDGPKRESSGFHVDVSDADWDRLGRQVEHAMHFLSQHRPELERLVQFPGVESIELDFPLDARVGDSCWMQSDTFPAALAKLAGELGIDLTFSIYASTDEK